MENIIKDKNRVLVGNHISEGYYTSPYLSDIPKPKAVFLPINEDEVVKIVKYANKHNIKMIAKGASTGAVGGQYSLTGDEFVIDLSLMNKIIDFDPKALILTVESGVTLETIQKRALELGLFYAPDPASKMSTIGGNVSTNAGGMRAVKYGTTRDYVKAMNVVLPNGELTTLGELTIKNSSGFRLKDLFIGSEGVLGIVTQVKLKLLPKPAVEKSLILAFDKLKDATHAVLEILKRGFDPTALELFDRETIHYSESFLKKTFPSQKGNVYILLTFDELKVETLESKIKHFLDVCTKTPVEVLLLSDEEAKLAWHLRDNILYALMSFTTYEMLDEVVPIHVFDQMIDYTKVLEEKHDIKVLNFGHAGDGNIHTILLRQDDPEDIYMQKRVAFLDDLYAKVKELGGLISAEHGIGITKKDYFIKMTDPIQIKMMRSIKKAIDPKNLMNPHKMI